MALKETYELVFENQTARVAAQIGSDDVEVRRERFEHLVPVQAGAGRPTVQQQEGRSAGRALDLTDEGRAAPRELDPPPVGERRPRNAERLGNRSRHRSASLAGPAGPGPC